MKRISLILLPVAMIVTAAVLSLVIVQSFGSPSCIQGQAGDQPPAAGATAWEQAGPTEQQAWREAYATQRASRQAQELSGVGLEALDGYVTPDLTGLIPKRKGGLASPPGPPPGTPPVSVGGLTSPTAGC